MHGQELTSHGLITFLIDRDLLQKDAIQQYAVLKEIEQLTEQGIGNKTQVVGIVSNRFNISERTVWNILKRQEKK